MIGRSGERGSGISVIAAWYDDDDDGDIYLSIYQSVCMCVYVCVSECVCVLLYIYIYIYMYIGTDLCMNTSAYYVNARAFV